MKVLLLTDVPPCDDFTAGIVLSAMVKFLPRGSICCFAVVNPFISLRMSPEFGGIPAEFHQKPLENWSWLPRKFPFDRLSSSLALAGETYTGGKHVKSLIDKAVEFGRDQHVDRVWAVLQGQTMIRMALAVAEALKVPLYSQVWDPFSWWAKANCLDDRTTRQTQDLFDRTIERSAAVATASHAMAENYRNQFGVKAIPVISSYPRAMACSPSVTPFVARSITIGMAGQFYAADEWLQLLTALEAVHWTVGGCRVTIVAMGPARPPAMPAGHVTFLGWKPQAEAVKILADCDFLYCPYPFDPAMEEVARQSFPSKLVLYLAAGRPVIFHGPIYSAVAQYIANKGCGVLMTKLSAFEIPSEIQQLFLNQQLYSERASNAQKAFLEDFTLESMARSFQEFIGAKAVEAVVLQDHARREEDSIQPDRLPPSISRSLLSQLVKYGGIAKRAWRKHGATSK
jgi:glycosyltransferase involved in cell wall biosynthesis